MKQFGLARLDPQDMGEVARLHRAAFNAAMPWLAGLHTQAEDLAFFRDHVYAACDVWGAVEKRVLLGFIAFREGFIDQLYVLPQAQGQGIGSALLAKAQAAFPRLSLWTFQRNLKARRFYEARGFELVESTDGRRNDEKEPDARYLWERDAARSSASII